MSFQKIDLIKIYKQKTALVIDDYPDMRGSIRRMLVNFGVDRVDTASNGAEAIDKCQDYPFDIILADYNLGDAKSGQQVLEELRYKHILKSTSVYMMITAETTKSMVFSALEYQPDDYVTKPFTQTVLQKRLDRLILEKEALYEINTAIDALNFDLAIELCQQRINMHDKYEQRCYRLMATCYFNKHKYQQSKDVYQKILAERPVEWASIGLGRCMMALNELDNAEEVFQKLVDDGCMCMEIYDHLADIKTRKGDSESAQDLLERAIEISPNAIMRQKRLAELCEDNHDWERAQKSHAKIIRLGHNSVYDSPENHFNLARSINKQIENNQDSAKQKIKEVQEILKRAKRRYRKHENIELQSDIIQANTFACAGQTDLANEEVGSIQQRLSTTTNRSAELMLDMAQTYKSIGDHEKAQELLVDLAARYGDNPDIAEAIDRISDEPLSKAGKQKAIELNQQGKELFANKDFVKAIQLFGQALKHYPNNIGLNLNMMLALVRQMSVQGPNPQMLERCQSAREKLEHLDESSPYFERFRVMRDHMEKMRGTVQ